MVQGNVPAWDLHGELYRGRNDIVNVETWPVEDANFLLKMTHRLKAGVLEKCVQGLPDTNQWFPTTLYPTGGPGRTKRWSGNDDECILLTSENWHFTWIWLKTPKTAIFDRRLRGPQWTHCGLPSSGGPPNELGLFLHPLWHREMAATSLLKTQKSWLHLVLVHLWRLASVQRWDALEQNSERLQKLEMQMEVSVFTASQKSPWMSRYSCFKFVSM